MVHKKFFYKIEGFIPPEKGREWGGWGFDVKLDSEIAKKALQTPLNNHAYNVFKERGDRIIDGAKAFFGPLFYTKPYYFFRLNGNHENELSCLLHYCEVPGNATSLSADYDVKRLLGDNSYNYSLEYSCHNVDNIFQREALISLWLFWVDLICVLET